MTSTGLLRVSCRRSVKSRVMTFSTVSSFSLKRRKHNKSVPSRRGPRKRNQGNRVHAYHLSFPPFRSLQTCFISYLKYRSTLGGKPNQSRKVMLFVDDSGNYRSHLWGLRLSAKYCTSLHAGRFEWSGDKLHPSVLMGGMA